MVMDDVLTFCFGVWRRPLLCRRFVCIFSKPRSLDLVLLDSNLLLSLVQPLLVQCPCLLVIFIPAASLGDMESSFE